MWGGAGRTTSDIARATRSVYLQDGGVIRGVAAACAPRGPLTPCTAIVHTSRVKGADAHRITRPRDTRPARLAPCVVSLAAIVLPGVLAGCTDLLPMAPSNLTTGIVVYVHANYQGESAHITTDVSDLRNIRGPCRAGDPQGSEGDPNWSDCISSIRVAPGWRATVYRNDGYRGESLVVTSDVPNLQLVAGTCDHDGMNDCMTSVRVVRP